MPKIHAALRLDKTSKLPSSLRLIAAAAINGSKPDLRKLYGALEDAHFPGEQAMCFLPVLYINLDPSHIPDSRELEDLISTSTLFELSLKTLYTLYVLSERPEFPYDAAVDLWPRVWPWIDFFHTYWAHLPGLDLKTVRWFRMTHSTLILKLAHGDSMQDVVLETPGTRRIIAGGWASMLHYGLPKIGPRRQASLTDLAVHLFALVSEVELRQNFDEILDALGSCHDLANTLIEYISLAVDDAGSAATDAVHAMVTFVQPTLRVYPDFTSALLSSRFISALVPALAIDRDIAHILGLPHRLIDLTLALLVEYMERAPGCTGLVEALRAGLLPHLARLLPEIVQRSYEGMYEKMKFPLHQFLPSGSVCYSVLTLLRTSFADIEATPYTQKFCRCKLFETWNQLKVLVDRRLKVLDAWDASDRSTSLACDNLKCGRIDDRHHFKYCSACQRSTYCSQLDELALTTRDKLFLRKLMDEDYKRLLHPQIVRGIIKSLYQRPTMPFCVQFAYDKPGDVIIEVLAAANTHPTEVLTHEGLAAAWERVARAEGRMEVHMIRIGLGRWVREFVFPLRTTGTRLNDGLRRIAGNLDALNQTQVDALIGVLVPTAMSEGRHIH
ncbi:hypothetical protein C8R46DRAFT_1191927 [Mycena filopes]|nr:hypothetical protein C8R46DRAFT_1191927 [Mycena filopes]